jgi:hypothetical protein
VTKIQSSIFNFDLSFFSCLSVCLSRCISFLFLSLPFFMEKVKQKQRVGRFELDSFKNNLT